MFVLVLVRIVASASRAERPAFKVATPQRTALAGMDELLSDDDESSTDED